MKNKKNLFPALFSAFILLSLISASGFLHISTIANASSVSSATISAVESGTTSTSSIILGPNPSPIGQTVSIDLRINNGAGIWGWTLPTVTWNPQVLSLIGVTEGPYLADNTAGASTFFLGNSKQLWNTTGSINGGLTEAVTADATSIESSGVIATLTFTVTGAGTSQIGIAGGNLRASSTDSVGTNIACNNATIIATLTAISSTPTPSATPVSSANPTSSPTQTNNPTQTTKPTPTDSSQPASVPEFPAVAVLPIFMVSLAAVISYRLSRKGKTPASSHPASEIVIRYPSHFDF